MNPSAGHLCTWPRNPIVRDSKRRPVVVLAPAYPGRSTVIVVPLTSHRLALYDQITCLPVSLLGEPFGQREDQRLALLRHRAALALGLMPSDLRPGG